MPIPRTRKPRSPVCSSTDLPRPWSSVHFRNASRRARAAVRRRCATPTATTALFSATTQAWRSPAPAVRPWHALLDCLLLRARRIVMASVTFLVSPARKLNPMSRVCKQLPCQWCVDWPGAAACVVALLSAGVPGPKITKIWEDAFEACPARKPAGHNSLPASHSTATKAMGAGAVPDA